MVIFTLQQPLIKKEPPLKCTILEKREREREKDPSVSYDQFIDSVGKYTLKREREKNLLYEKLHAVALNFFGGGN